MERANSGSVQQATSQQLAGSARRLSRATASVGAHAVLRRRRYWGGHGRREAWFWLGRMPEGEVDIEEAGDGRIAVWYPWKFKIFVIAATAAAVGWLINYQMMVLPTLREHKSIICTSEGGSSLPRSATMLFLYFIWFAVIRIALFVPFVVQKVTKSLVNRIRGVNHLYVAHALLRDMPLYLFVVGSMLFMFYLAQSENCADSRELYHVLRLFASLNCLLSPVIGLFAVWHNMILFHAASRSLVIIERQAARPAVDIDSLDTVTLTPEKLHEAGDEDGKAYPAECVICLGHWEENDVIKVTPCQHVFHEACLRTWLQTATTCAMCRHDLLSPSRYNLSPSSSRQLESQGSGQILGAAQPGEEEQQDMQARV